MALSNDLLTQFAKIANKKEEPKKETTVYGTVVYDGATYVRIDGSDLLTPIATTTDVKDDDRVTVTIKNHNAIVTGNLDSPSVNKKTTIKIDETESTTVGEFGTVIAGKISAQRAEFNELIAKKATIEQLEAEKATINELLAKKATIEQLEAERAEIDTLLAGKLTADTADIKYAQIDFANIGKAAMEYFYAQSGLIENVTVGDATIAGNLVGVTIKGDLIEGGTVVADKLVIKGTDGLYYKLNTAGLTDEEGNTITEAEQTDYNSLNGQVIAAKSITASKVDVSDLVAFNATIGGFEIGANSISSYVKDSDDSTVRGIYMDTNGQFNFGDSNNFVRYYKDEDGTYKLAISAETIMYHLNGSNHSIADIGALTDYVKVGIYETDEFVYNGVTYTSEDLSSFVDPKGSTGIRRSNGQLVYYATNADGDTIYYTFELPDYIGLTRITEPCIELGQRDSDFKMVITNTRILFLEGDTIPAYINNQALNIDKAVIDNELQIGGFVWKKRANGNVGLMWKE